MALQCPCLTKVNTKLILESTFCLFCFYLIYHLNTFLVHFIPQAFPPFNWQKWKLKKNFWNISVTKYWIPICNVFLASVYIYFSFFLGSSDRFFMSQFFVLDWYCHQNVLSVLSKSLFFVLPYRLIEIWMCKPKVKVLHGRNTTFQCFHM